MSMHPLVRAETLAQHLDDPRWIVFVDELPKNSYGKVLKRELRLRYATEPAPGRSP